MTLPNPFLDAHMRLSYARGAAVADQIIRAGRVYGYGTQEFLTLAVDTVLVGQTEQVLSTWSTLSTLVANATDGVELAVEAPVDALIGAATHDGTPLETVYRRPAALQAELLAEDLDIDEVTRRVESEVRLMADADVMTAGRHTEQAYGAADNRVVGWKRVPNAGACRWCLYIATQKYTKADLAPAHRGCHCGTEPITERTTGSTYDPEALAQIKAEGVPKRYGQRRRESRAANAAID